MGVDVAPSAEDDSLRLRRPQHLSPKYLESWRANTESICTTYRSAEVESKPMFPVLIKGTADSLKRTSVLVLSKRQHLQRGSAHTGKERGGAPRNSWALLLQLRLSLQAKLYRTVTCPLIRSFKGRSGWSVQAVATPMKVKLT
jgi:hypothetical protein